MFHLTSTRQKGKRENIDATINKSFDVSTLYLLKTASAITNTLFLYLIRISIPLLNDIVSPEQRAVNQGTG